VEEVVQAKLVEERNRRARELNLKVRELPTPPPSSDPLSLASNFITNKLGLPEVHIDRAWLGDSTLFLRFKSVEDRLRALRATRRLFSLPDKIFLNEDLTKAQVAELIQSRELVMAARKAGKWA
ncbi:hypothetical protein KI387_031797, partial [Taxus chinensis]